MDPIIKHHRVINSSFFGKQHRFVSSILTIELLQNPYSHRRFVLVRKFLQWVLNRSETHRFTRKLNAQQATFQANLAKGHKITSDQSFPCPPKIRKLNLQGRKTVSSAYCRMTRPLSINSGIKPLSVQIVLNFQSSIGNIYYYFYL